MNLSNPEVLYLTLLIVVVVGLFISIIIFYRPKTTKSLPISTSPQYVLALLALLEGDKRSAFEALRGEVHQNPHNFDAYLRLGNLFREQGDHDKALQIHQQLTARTELPDREWFQLYFAMAHDLKAAHKYTAAIKALQRNLERDSSHLPTLKEMFILNELGEKWDEAFDMLRKIQKIENRKSPEELAIYLSEIGRHRMIAGDHESAANYFKQALKLDKTCTPAHLFFGDMLYQQGETKTAISYWEKIVRYNPEEAVVLLDRIEPALYEVGLYQNVEKIYSQLSSDFPEEPRYLLALARVYERQGMIDEALTRCKTAIELDPANQHARLLLIDLYRKSGNMGSAWEELARSLETRVDHRLTYICQSCGAKADDPRWYCPECRQWRTYV